MTTLTGFKWISRVPHLVIGYEEALGYCVDPVAVTDKDGVTAALLVVELVATLKARGRTLLDLLDDLAATHGAHVTAQVSVRQDDPAATTAVVTALLSVPPATLGGLVVTRVEDLSAGVDGLAPTSGVRLVLGAAGRVVVRPSGTEPKLKAYLEVVEPVPTDVSPGALAAAWAAARARLAAVRDDVAALVGAGSA